MKSEGVKLDPLARLRVGYWFNVLRMKSGMEWPELSKTLQWIDLGEVNFKLYAEQRRTPSETTRKLLDKEFPGTLEAYDLGPKGWSLWNILKGDRDACMTLVNTQLAEMPDVSQHKLFFRQQVGQFWRFLLPEYLHQWKSVEELVAISDFNIFSDTYEKGLKDDARFKTVKHKRRNDTHVLYSPSGAIPRDMFIRYYADIGRTFSCATILAIVALWRLCHLYPESDADAMCRYMLAGLLEQAVPHEFPEEIGSLLKTYLVEELAASA